jgi:hypothetical protein
MRHGTCPSDASQSKSRTQAHERIGAGSGFPAADDPRGTSSPREKRRIFGAPAHLKEDEARGSHGRLGLRNPTGTDCPQGTKNPEAAANDRDRLSLTNVGDNDLNRVQHSRSPDKIIGATFGKRQVGQADPTRIQSLAGRSNTAKGKRTP